MDAQSLSQVAALFSANSAFSASSALTLSFSFRFSNFHFLFPSICPASIRSSTLNIPRNQRTSLMLLFMQSHATDEQVRSVCDKIESLGLNQAERFDFVADGADLFVR